ncbi:MAG TPA: dTDP-4-dehydrorhamnose 3,5-epimerase family protein, partial [Puia sp.]|nr:dTDP-4-dehydrorhamnose 3,5-epimerase family protein [Puia sp.]
MPFTENFINGIVIFEPNVYPDQRGFFFESYNKQLFNDNGIFAEFIQDNQSFSLYGVIRGLHYQREPFAQAKLVRVLEGSILD